MLAQEVLLQLQKYNFDLLARQEPSGRRRLRYIALAHIKDGKSATETALALRVTPRAVTRWLKWFVDEGLDRLAGVPHYWSPQRLPKTQEEAFRQAVEQLQDRRGGGRVRGEDIRQLLAGQFGGLWCKLMMEARRVLFIAPFITRKAPHSILPAPSSL
jgi:transposase